MILELSPSFVGDYVATTQAATITSPEKPQEEVGWTELIGGLANLAATTYLQVVQADQATKQLQLQRDIVQAQNAQKIFAPTPSATPVLLPGTTTGTAPTVPTTVPAVYYTAPPPTVAGAAAAPAPEAKMPEAIVLLPIVLILGAILIGAMRGPKGPGARKDYRRGR